MTWPMARLDDVIDFIRGITFKPTDVVPPFTHDSIVVMRTKNVQVEGLDCSDLISVPRHFMKREEQRLKDGDLLISSANSWELVGKTSFVEKLDYDATAGGFISIVRAKKNNVDPKYLYYWLVTPETQHTIRHLGKQTTNISNLDVARFKRLEIPLPPLVEQKRIAAILDKADAIRQKRQQAIALADKFLRSVFLDMFGDPVTNPKGWTIRKLDELINSGPTNGLYKPSSSYGSGTRILRIDGFYDGVLTSQESLKRVEVSKDELSRFSLPERSIIINRVNSPDYLGKCAFINELDEPTVFESNMMCFTVDEELINPVFLTQQLQMPNIKQQIKNCAKDAVNQSSINQQDVKSFDILLPDVEEQNNFESICNELIQKRKKIANGLSLTDYLFNSLAQKTFSG